MERPLVILHGLLCVFFPFFLLRFLPAVQLIAQQWYETELVVALKGFPP